MRLSHSSIDTYKRCGELYRLRYIERLAGKLKSSALYFGSALDVGFEALLQGKSLEDAKKAFEAKWEVGDTSDKQPIKLRSSNDIVYFTKDYDPDLLDLSVDEKDAMTAISELKKTNGFNNLDPKDQQFFQEVHWDSLYEKGLLMIEAYQRDILPKIKKVISTQVPLTLKNVDGDEIVGFADQLVELLDGSHAILDNKSASKAYPLNSAEEAEQLNLYSAIYNTFEQHSVPVTKQGYCVVIKDLAKDRDCTCASCGHTDTNPRHKTCNNTINGKRCTGEWKEQRTIRVKTQFLVAPVSEVIQDKVLLEINTAHDKIANKQFTKNEDSCFAFGQKCEFYNLCYNNDNEGLIKLPERDNNGKK